MLTAGTQLGPYKILAPLGAGGMGEVYRARDARLGRDVAIKVLPSHLAATPEVRARFEREARTISQLSHPHICTLFDVGHQDGVDYLVMELLEGETLARRIEKGPLPVAELLSIGKQVAGALARAHQAGVVHRDLKPGNVMLTKSGAKLMDFGLARAQVLAKRPAAMTQSPTVSQPLTAEGTIVGTLQYMAPEQLEGKEADARADIWALGCVLYEMSTGSRAFAGDSQASVIAAIMTGEPRAMAELRPVTPPALERVVVRCLAKDPDERFQSASDLAFDLDAISWASGTAAVTGTQAGARRSFASRFGWIAATLVAGLLVGAAAMLVLQPRRGNDPARIKYTRLTVQRGFSRFAHFAPDGNSVFFLGEYGAGDFQTFEVRPGFLAARPLGLPNSILLDVSRQGMLALLVDVSKVPTGTGNTLAEVPIVGGTPRRLLDNVGGAAYAPDGRTMAVNRYIAGRWTLEMPPGRVLRDSVGELLGVSVSPDGRRVAFMQPGVNGSRIAIIDTTGRDVAGSGLWKDISSPCWSADGREVWFTAVDEAGGSELRALSPNGRERGLARFDGSVLLWDVGRDGRLLASRNTGFEGIVGWSAVSGQERELGWYDSPAPNDISSDGRSLLFTERGIFGGKSSAVCLRGMDGSSPVRLGSGRAACLSPDGRWALAIQESGKQRVVLFPTGSGDSLVLPSGNIERYSHLSWMPDSRSILFTGREAGHRRRIYRQGIEGGTPRPITPEGTAGPIVSPDGRYITYLEGGNNEPRHFQALDGSSDRVVPEPDSLTFREWSEDPKYLIASLYSPLARYIRLYKVDVHTMKPTLMKHINIPDPVGFSSTGIVVSPRGNAYAYNWARTMEDLYLIEGLK